MDNLNRKSYHPKWGDDQVYDILPNAKKIILGSMPPKKLCLDYAGKRFKNTNDINYFYGSNKNLFWNILGYIYENDNRENIGKNKLLFADNIEDTIFLRKKFMHNNYIGLVDIFKSCIHGDEYSDSKIEYEEDDLIDLCDILTKNSEITQIYCTSNYVKNKLKKHFIDELHYIHDSDKKNYKHAEIKIKNIDRKIELFVLYSPTFKVGYRMLKNDKNNYLKYYKKLLENKK